MPRSVIGSAVGLASCAALAGVLFPLRTHISIATAGLVLVVPVVAGVILGGYAGGLVSVAGGFLVYDWVFIPPYYTLNVGAGQNWIALVVYVVVMLLVARVVVHLQDVRSEAQRRAEETQKVFELSEILVEDRSVEEILQTIVGTTRNFFGVDGVALLLPEGDRLVVAAAAGEVPSDDELSRLGSASGPPVAVGTETGGGGSLRAVSLSAAGRPVGILALRRLPGSEANRALLRTFANHAALALERARLKEQALRSETLEEIDRIRDALLGAVTHDLRTPLATMKVASSTLLDPESHLTPEDTKELYGLLDTQTDRLTRLVTSLLDLGRYEAGALKLERTTCAMLDLVAEVLAGIRGSLGDRVLSVDILDNVPPVECDPLLIGQVLINLIDNADRHAPAGTPITVRAQSDNRRVLVSVEDQGPGVPRQERTRVFETYVRFDTGGRAGLGLAIAQTFVQAHGEEIWVEEGPGGGARFVFSLPATDPSEKGRV